MRRPKSDTTERKRVGFTVYINAEQYRELQALEKRLPPLGFSATGLMTRIMHEGPRLAIEYYRALASQMEEARKKEGTC